MSWESIKQHLLEVTAAATILGGGTAILTNTVKLAQHDTRLEYIERMDDKIDKIAADISTTKQDVAVVKARLEKPYEQSH